MSLASTLVERVHGGYVANRRVRVLRDVLTTLLPRDVSLLDVGSGDGILAAEITSVRPDVRVTGIDVLVRPDARIPVRPFDGQRIPVADGGVDYVLLVDVLHHTDDPTVLLRESRRVARRGVVLKDHLRDRPLAGPTLRLMDWVGNARYGVALPYNYLRRAEWDAAFVSAGLEVEAWRTGMPLYPPPASLLFGGSLHFAARLRPAA